MLQLISHLFGDFVFQNDWMALNKNQYTLKGWIACFVHCIVYTLFFYAQGNLLQLGLIFISHFIIDKFSIARMWINIKNPKMDNKFWLYTYLLFMIDMAFHLACNFITLKYI